MHCYILPSRGAHLRVLFYQGEHFYKYEEIPMLKYGLPQINSKCANSCFCPLHYILCREYYFSIFSSSTGVVVAFSAGGPQIFTGG